MMISLISLFSLIALLLILGVATYVVFQYITIENQAEKVPVRIKDDYPRHH